MQTTDRYTNKEVADNLAYTKRDVLKLSETLARFQRVTGPDLYPTGDRMLSRTIEDLNALASTLDERMELLNEREAR